MFRCFRWIIRWPESRGTLKVCHFSKNILLIVPEPSSYKQSGQSTGLIWIHFMCSFCAFKIFLVFILHTKVRKPFCFSEIRILKQFSFTNSFSEKVVITDIAMKLTLLLFSRKVAWGGAILIGKRFWIFFWVTYP